MLNELIIIDFKRRLENIIFKHGTDDLFDYSIDLITALELENDISFTENEMNVLDEIVNSYKEG